MYNPNSYGGGYPQGNPPAYGQGEAASYYAGAQQQQYPPPDQPGYGQPPHGQPGYGQPGYGQPEQYQRDDNNGPQQEGQDGERGFLGALGGGVAGAVGGNKIGGKMGHSKLSTVLGAVAGAVAGHKLQDGVSEWKDKRDEKKEQEKREEEERKRWEEQQKYQQQHQPPPMYHQSSSPPPPPSSHHHHHHHEQQSRSLDGPSYAGNFSSSSRDIRLEPHGEYMLHASCRRLDGSYQASSISLNQLIENDQGSFRWSSGRGGGGGGYSSGPTTVTVQPGDTLRGIAAQVGCSFEEIARHNGLQNPDMIYPGQVLQVPGGSGHGGGSVGNFGASARDVRLADGGRRLEGELLRDGRWVGSSIALDERIGNDNGTLRFV